VSIRWRITLMAGVASLVILLVTSAAIVKAHERLLVDGLDERLQQSVDAYLADTDGVDVALSLPGDEDSVAQLVRGETVVDLATPATGEARSRLDKPVADPPPVGSQRVTRTISDVLLGEGSYRVLSAAVGDGTVVHSAISLDDVRDSTSALLRVLAVAVPLAAVGLGALIWWFVGRTLQPVEAIRVQVASIGAGELVRRVPVAPIDDELGRLARTMNGMLDRLERSAVQQRRFVADASHELRSPLTRMRSELEVDLAHPRSADPQATTRSTLDEVIGLQHLVDDLLSLARQSPAATDRTKMAAVDLDDLVVRAARRVRADGRLALDTTAVGPARVLGDPRQLGRVVSNLLDNATRHARSVVTVELREGSGAATLIVADDGPGIPAAERERVFEPFTRLDEARATAAGGVGLGLAIVHDIVDAHEGTVSVIDRPGGGAAVVVTLPAAP
jgi:signal transduction histidine kinase